MNQHVAAFLTALELAALSGCGHTIEPNGPFGNSDEIPAPREVRALASFNSIRVSWQATPADRQVVDAWRVERRTTLEGMFQPVPGGTRMDTLFIDEFVEDDTRYVYRVMALTGAGVASRPVESPSVRADLQSPTTPAEISLVSLPGALQILISPVPDPGLAYFLIRIVESESTAPPFFDQAFTSPDTIQGLNADSYYLVFVAAVDSAGHQSSFSFPPATGQAGASSGGQSP